MREGHLPRFGFHVSRADVADCVVKTCGKIAPMSEKFLV